MIETHAELCAKPICKPIFPKPETQFEEFTSGEVPRIEF